MRKLPVLLALIALGLFAFAGCGDDEESTTAGGDESTTTTTDTGDDTTSSGGGGTVDVAADPGGSLAYVQSSLEAKAGKVTFAFENGSSTPHDFSIEDADGNAVAATDIISNDTADLEVELDPGEYVFYCSVGGHRPAGMEGPLTVK